MDVLLKVTFDYLEGLNARWNKAHPDAQNVVKMTYRQVYTWMFHDLKDNSDFADMSLSWEFRTADYSETFSANYPSPEVAPEWLLTRAWGAVAYLTACHKEFEVRVHVCLGDHGDFGAIDDDFRLFIKEISICALPFRGIRLTDDHIVGWRLGTWHPLMNLRATQPDMNHVQMDPCTQAAKTQELKNAFTRATIALFQAPLRLCQDGHVGRYPPLPPVVWDELVDSDLDDL